MGVAQMKPILLNGKDALYFIERICYLNSKSDTNPIRFDLPFSPYTTNSVINHFRYLFGNNVGYNSLGDLMQLFKPPLNGGKHGFQILKLDEDFYTIF